MAAPDEILPAPADTPSLGPEGPQPDWNEYFSTPGQGEAVTPLGSALAAAQQGVRQGAARSARNVATLTGMPQATQDYYKELATQRPDAFAPFETTNPDSVVSGLARGAGQMAPVMAATTVLPGWGGLAALGADAAQGAKQDALDANNLIDQEVAKRRAVNPNDPNIDFLLSKKVDPATASAKAVADLLVFAKSGQLLHAVAPAIGTIANPLLRGAVHGLAETGINLGTDLGLQAATNPEEFGQTISDPAKLAERVGTAGVFGALGGARAGRQALADRGPAFRTGKVTVGRGFDVPPPLPEPEAVPTPVQQNPELNLNPLTTTTAAGNKAPEEPTPTPGSVGELPATPPPLPTEVPPSQEPMTPAEAAFKQKADEALKNLRAADPATLAQMFEQAQNPAERALIMREMQRRAAEQPPPVPVAPADLHDLQQRLGQQSEPALIRIQELADRHNWSETEYRQALEEALRNQPPALPKPDEQKGSTQTQDGRTEGVGDQAAGAGTEKPNAEDQLRGQPGNADVEPGAGEQVREQREQRPGPQGGNLPEPVNEPAVSGEPNANVKVRRQGKQRAGAKEQPVLSAADEVLPNAGSLAAGPVEIPPAVEAAEAADIGQAPKKVAAKGKKVIPKREVTDIESDLEELNPQALHELQQEQAVGGWDEKQYKKALNQRLYRERKAQGLIKGEAPKEEPLPAKAVAEPAKPKKAPKKQSPEQKVKDVQAKMAELNAQADEFEKAGNKERADWYRNEAKTWQPTLDKALKDAEGEPAKALQDLKANVSPNRQQLDIPAGGLREFGANLRRAVANFRGEFPHAPNIVVVHSDNLPHVLDPDIYEKFKAADKGPGGRIRAFADPNTEQVYLLTDRLGGVDAKELRMILHEETFGHLGIEGALRDPTDQNAFKREMDVAFNHMVADGGPLSRQFAKLVGEYKGSTADPHEIVQDDEARRQIMAEVIAHNAGKYLHQGWVNRAWQGLRDVLGRATGLDLSTREDYMRRLVDAGAKYLKERAGEDWDMRDYSPAERADIRANRARNRESAEKADEALPFVRTPKSNINETNGKLISERPEDSTTGSILAAIRQSNGAARATLETGNLDRQRQQRQLIAAYRAAKSEGRDIQADPSFTSKFKQYGEHGVTYDEDSNRWFKYTKPGTTGIRLVATPDGGLHLGANDLQGYLQDKLAWNKFFGDDVRVHGIMKAPSGRPVVITSQPNYEPVEPVPDLGTIKGQQWKNEQNDKIKKYFRRKGFKQIANNGTNGMTFYHPTDKVVLSDMKPYNVMEVRRGNGTTMKVIDGTLNQGAQDPVVQRAEEHWQEVQRGLRDPEDRGDHINDILNPPAPPVIPKHTISDLKYVPGQKLHPAFQFLIDHGVLPDPRQAANTPLRANRAPAPEPAQESWLDPEGKIHDANAGHREFAEQYLGQTDDAYGDMAKRGWKRLVNDNGTLYLSGPMRGVGAGGLTKAQKEALEDQAFYNQLHVVVDNGKRTVTLFQPVKPPGHEDDLRFNRAAITPEMEREVDNRDNTNYNTLDARIAPNAIQEGPGSDPTRSAIAYLEDRARARGETQAPDTINYAQRYRDQSRDLIQWARDNGRILNPKLYSQAPNRGGGEHDAFYQQPEHRWVKETIDGELGMKPHAKTFHPGSPDDLSLLDHSELVTPLDYLRRLADANDVFGDDRRFHGLVLNANGRPSVVSSQPHYERLDPNVDFPEGQTRKNMKQVMRLIIEKQMKDRGFIHVGNNTWYHPKHEIVAMDVRPENVAISKDWQHMMPFDIMTGDDPKVLAEAQRMAQNVKEGKANFDTAPMNLGGRERPITEVNTPPDIKAQQQALNPEGNPKRAPLEGLRANRAPAGQGYEIRERPYPKETEDMRQERLALEREFKSFYIAHGSPFVMERLNIAKHMGAGEGHQAFSPGGYVSGDTSTGGGYRNNVYRRWPDATPEQERDYYMRQYGEEPPQWKKMKDARDKIERLDEEIAQLYNYDDASLDKQIESKKKDLQAARRETIELESAIKEWAQAKEDSGQAERQLGRGGKRTPGTPGGHLYEGSLNVHPDMLFHWDKTLDQQSPYIQKRLKMLGFEPPAPTSGPTREDVAKQAQGVWDQMQNMWGKLIENDAALMDAVRETYGARYKKAKEEAVKAGLAKPDSKASWIAELIATGRIGHSAKNLAAGKLKLNSLLDERNDMVTQRDDLRKQRDSLMQQLNSMPIEERLTGQHIFKRLTDQALAKATPTGKFAMQDEAAARDAARQLYDLGIPAQQHQRGDIRGVKPIGPDPTDYNFVAYDDSRVKFDKINGQPINESNVIKWLRQQDVVDYPRFNRAPLEKPSDKYPKMVARAMRIQEDDVRTIRDALRYGLDARDNVADNSGVRAENDVAAHIAMEGGNRVKNSKEAVAEREAVLPLVEAGYGDATEPEELAAAYDKLLDFQRRVNDILASPQPVDPAELRLWQKRRAAAERLKAPTDKAVEIAQDSEKATSWAGKVHAEFNAQQAERMAHGLPSKYFENYVKRVIAADPEEESAFAMPMSGGGSAGFDRSENNARRYETVYDAMENGKKLAAMDVAGLVGAGQSTTAKMVANQELFDRFRDMNVPGTQRKVLQNARKVWNPLLNDGKGGFETKSPGPQYKPVTGPTGERFFVDGEFAPYFTKLLKDSYVRNDALLSGLLHTAADLKHGILLFDTFHVGRVMARLFNLMLQSRGYKALGGMDIPMELLNKVGIGDVRYGKGRAALDFKPDTLDAAEQLGWISPKDRAWAEANQHLVKLAEESGYNVAGNLDNLYERSGHGLLNQFLHKLGGNVKGEEVSVGKGIETFNKWVFQKLTRNAMMIGWKEAFERNQARFPELSQKEIARYTSKEMNEYFGNLGRQGVFQSATAQDFARLAFLAPQWSNAMIASQIRGLRQFATAGGKLLHGERAPVGNVAGAMGAGFLAMLAANQILNLVTKRQPTWDNEEGHKLDAYIPGGKHGFYLNPASIVAEEIHTLMRYREGGAGIMDSLGRIFANKASPYTRAAMAELPFVHRDSMLRPIAPGKEHRAALQALNPLPIFSGAATGDLINPEMSQKGDALRQLFGMAGLKLDRAQGPGQKLRNMAKETIPDEFPKSESPGEYAPLRAYINNENDSKAKAEILDLLRKGKSLPEISKVFAPKPIGRSYANQGLFLRRAGQKAIDILPEAATENAGNQTRLAQVLQSIPLDELQEAVQEAQRKKME